MSEELDFIEEEIKEEKKKEDTNAFNKKYSIDRKRQKAAEEKNRGIIKKEVVKLTENQKGVAMVEKEKSEESEAGLVEVPTQTAVAFRLVDGRVVDERTLLLEIYKDLQIVKKFIV
jgi:hypothetical protein